MTPSDKSKGCTVSGGRNYLSAMTYYGYRHSVPVNIIIPKDCPLADKQRFKESYAIIKVYGNDLTDASLHALTYSDQIGSNYIHGWLFFITSKLNQIIQLRHWEGAYGRQN